MIDVTARCSVVIVGIGSFTATVRFSKVTVYLSLFVPCEAVHLNNELILN